MQASVRVPERLRLSFELPWGRPEVIPVLVGALETQSPHMRYAVARVHGDRVDLVGLPASDVQEMAGRLRHYAVVRLVVDPRLDDCDVQIVDGAPSDDPTARAVDLDDLLLRSGSL